MPADTRSATAPGVYAFDDFEVDVPAFELRRSGAAVPMEPQAFEVLAFLVENAGRVLTKDEILDKVWPERFVSEASLNSRVMSARKALGDSGSAQRYIKTVHGRGYRFIGALNSAPEPTVAEAPAELPAPAPIQLRPRLSSLIGRETELARIQALMLQSSCRLLTIAGQGGAGKTRLAFEAAANLSAAGRECVVIQLEHVEPPVFLAALASELGIQPGATDLLSQVTRYLSSRELTLVLDNLEHLVDAARPAIEALLAGAPGLQLMVTSRTTIGLLREWVLRLEGLSLESDGSAPAPAVRLFLERAGRAEAAMDPGDAQAASAICELVEGHPLAIEIAASLARYVPLASIRELIETGAASSLAASLHDIPERHRSCHALFEASVAQLEEQWRDALATLAVFEGPFDAAASEAIAGAPFSVLTTLVDRSLLLPRDGRFALHPLLRQYLRAPDSSPAHRCAEAHADYYTAFVESHTAALQGRGQLEAMAAMEADSSNLVAAWRWATANRRVDLLERARRGLFSYLIFRGRFLEAHELAELALPAIDESEHPFTAVGLLVHHVWLLMRIGQTSRAAETLQKALAISRSAEIGWVPGFGGDPRLALAAFTVGAGDYAGAHEIARHALALAEAAGDEPGIAFAAWMNAVSLWRLAELECRPRGDGRFDWRPAPGDTRIAEAAAYLERARTILEAQDEVWLRAYVEIERGLAANSNGNRESGCAHFRTAYALRKKLDDPQGMASALMYLSDSLVDMGMVEEATRLHDEMRTLLLRTADATGETELLRSSGNAASVAGDFDRARDLLRQALEASRAIGFANNVTGCLRALGEIFLAEGDTDLAARIMRTVAAHPSTTPGARGKARMVLGEMGLEVPAISDEQPLDALVDEVVRAAVPLHRWLDSNALAGSAA